MKKLVSYDKDDADWDKVYKEFNLAYNACSRVAAYIDSLKNYIRVRSQESGIPTYDEEVESYLSIVLADKQKAMEFIKEL